MVRMTSVTKPVSAATRLATSLTKDLVALASDRLRGPPLTLRERRRNRQIVAHEQRQGFAGHYGFAVQTPDAPDQRAESLVHLVARLRRGRWVHEAGERLVDQRGLGRAGAPEFQVEPPRYIVGQIDPDLERHDPSRHRWG
jgi:hypothetical protein